jgi:hypothetical protein
MKPGDEVTIFGKVYTLIQPAFAGLWYVCERDNWDAKIVLKEIKAAGK